MSWAQTFPSDTRKLDGPGYENHDPFEVGLLRWSRLDPWSNNPAKDPIKSFNIARAMSSLRSDVVQRERTLA